jgi:hypothetical protein
MCVYDYGTRILPSCIFITRIFAGILTVALGYATSDSFDKSCVRVQQRAVVCPTCLLGPPHCAVSGTGTVAYSDESTRYGNHIAEEWRRGPVQQA